MLIPFSAFLLIHIFVYSKTDECKYSWLHGHTPTVVAAAFKFNFTGRFFQSYRWFRWLGWLLQKKSWNCLMRTTGWMLFLLQISEHWIAAWLWYCLELRSLHIVVYRLWSANTLLMLWIGEENKITASRTASPPQKKLLILVQLRTFHRPDYNFILLSVQTQKHDLLVEVYT